MSKLISFTFHYGVEDYYALINVREQSGQTHYLVSVMNSNHEKMIHGNYIITEVDGVLLVNDPMKSSEFAQLKTAVAKNLSEYLDKPFRIIPPLNNTTPAGHA